MTLNEQELNEKLWRLAKQRTVDQIIQYYVNKYGGLKYLYALTAPIDEFVFKYRSDGYKSSGFNTTYSEMNEHRSWLVDQLYRILGLEFKGPKDLTESPDIKDEIFKRVRQDCRRLIEPKGERKSEIERRRR